MSHTQLLLKNARINQNDQLVARDVLLDGNRIVRIAPQIDADEAAVIDLAGALLTNGLVDVHVHLREPGFTYKETIASGSRAAARGGFTTICAMPNLNPVPDTTERFEDITRIIERDAVVRVHQYAPITQNLRSEQLVDFDGLTAAGAFAFTNDGVGVQTAGTMYEAMRETARCGKVLVAHTEDESLLYSGVMHAGTRSAELGLPGMLALTESTQIARDVLLAEATGSRYHVCHVSSKESVRVIRDAKAAGIPVSAEVSPHHLLLCDSDIPADDAQWKMNPPLRTAADREALREALADGTIDIIATDHAPHGDEEKSCGMVGAPFGIVGSETAFALLYTHLVKTGWCRLSQLIEWLTIKPCALFDLPIPALEEGAIADLAAFDLETPYTIDAAHFASQGHNTPFQQWTVYGETVLTIVDGRIAYQKP